MLFDPHTVTPQELIDLVMDAQELRAQAVNYLRDAAQVDQLAADQFRDAGRTEAWKIAMERADSLSHDASMVAHARHPETFTGRLNVCVYIMRREGVSRVGQYAIMGRGQL